jgi:hypothetical protein
VDLRLSAFSKLEDGNHTILTATFPGPEALDASPAHPWKPQLAWLSLYWSADLRLSAFSKSADGNHAILTATFPRPEALDTSPAHPWKPQLAWLSLYWGADLRLSAFRIGRDRKTRAFLKLKQKADGESTNHVRSSGVIELLHHQSQISAMCQLG